MSTLELLLPNRALDWVEIALIGVVIYLLLRLVRGTMAESILRGAVILAAIAVVVTALLVSSLEFEVLGKLLSLLTTAVVTVLIVVFQPELRRGLLSLGEHRIIHTFTPRKRGCEDEIADAVTSLVRERHGALFCIERFNSLHHIARTGVPVDADARAELLGSIFWPGNPLHDGAVILRGNRLIAAACILPVTERTDLATRLGTRHRAALGLAEESDAVVVVVSEETGTVSIAVDSELTPVDDPAGLAGILRGLTGASVHGNVSVVDPGNTFDASIPLPHTADDAGDANPESPDDEGEDSETDRDPEAAA